jgi:hypothetical protein
MDAVTPLVPSIVKPRRLRNVIIGAVIASTVAGAITLYGVERLHQKPFVDADERRAKIDEARVVAKKYAYEGFPAWVLEHPEYPCPQKLAELDIYVGRRDTVDPWGLPFQSYCHSGNTFRVVSAGPDRTHGTHDDIAEGT